MLTKIRDKQYIVSNKETDTVLYKCPKCHEHSIGLAKHTWTDTCPHCGTKIFNMIAYVDPMPDVKASHELQAIRTPSDEQRAHDVAIACITCNLNSTHPDTMIDDYMRIYYTALKRLTRVGPNSMDANWFKD
jgi:DNA-directed RNA polymerase subunit RPC12/RpoP